MVVGNVMGWSPMREHFIIFGLCSVSKIFNAVANAMEWIVWQQWAAPVFRYLDDCTDQTFKNRAMCYLFIGSATPLLVAQSAWCCEPIYNKIFVNWDWCNFTQSTFTIFLSGTRSQSISIAERTLTSGTAGGTTTRLGITGLGLIVQELFLSGFTSTWKSYKLRCVC